MISNHKKLWKLEIKLNSKKARTDSAGDKTGPPVSESETIDSSFSCLMWQTIKM